MSKTSQVIVAAALKAGDIIHATISDAGQERPLLEAFTVASVHLSSEWVGLFSPAREHSHLLTPSDRVRVTRES